VQVEVGMSTAFGCTLQGGVPEDDVIRLAEQPVAAGAHEVGLSDTTGMANPAQVRSLFSRLRSSMGPHAGATHMHNTRGLGLANCLGPPTTRMCVSSTRRRAGWAAARLPRVPRVTW